MSLLLKFFPWLEPYVLVVKLVAALAIATALMGAGAWIEAKAKSVEIAQLKMDALQTRATGAETALTDLKDAAAKIKAAADQFNALDDSLVTRMDIIRKDIRNAKPLPPDCHPDTVRVQHLADAISATNQTIAGQLISASLPASAPASQ